MSQQVGLQWRVTGMVMGIAAIAICHPSMARPIPDETLGNERSQVLDASDRDFAITGGATRGRNLLHSFSEFNVGEGGSVYFFDPGQIDNILTRVTGENPSNINGVLGTFGVENGAAVRSTANLLLMNPNGIIFGVGASLDIGGSFVGTTANAIGFGEQGFFSATNPEVPNQLLTVNPSAFLFSQIETQPSNSIESQSFLTVSEGRSLILIGGSVSPTPTSTGNVLINGGRLRAPGGRIELGGLGGLGTVELITSGNLLQLNYFDNVPRVNVTLIGSSDVDVTSGNGGSISINAQNIEILENSDVCAGIGATPTCGGLSVNSGTLSSQAGDIILNARETVMIAEAGSTVENDINPSSTGNGGNINIQAGSVLLQNNSLLSVSNYGQGRAGNLFIEAEDLTLSNGGEISVSTFGRGNVGRVDLDVEDRIVLDGSEKNSFIHNDVEFEAEGDTGGISINTGSLFIIDGSQITASVEVEGQGNTGDITIEADNVVSLSGSDFRSNTVFFPSAIFASVEGTGNSGNITIESGSLRIANRAQISATTEGVGNPGDIRIEVRDEVSLLNSIIISEVTQGTGEGQGGNITIEAGSLELRNGSSLLADTENRGDAGNITIEVRGDVTLSGTGPGASDSNVTVSSQISTTVESEAVGEGGDIQINVGTLRLSDGAFISASTLGQGGAGDINIGTRSLTVSDSSVSASTFSAGSAGNLTIYASNSINLSGEDRDARNGVGSPGGLFAQVERNGTGDGGTLSIETGILSVSDGSKVQVATFSDGNAGELFIQASDINILDTIIPNRYSTGIFAGVEIDPLTVELPDGNGGDLTIRTNWLSIRGGQVSSRTFGIGDAGNLDIEARDSIELAGSNSFISSAVNEEAVGQGGSININTGTLSLSDRASITSSTSGQGDTGTISIQADDHISLTNQSQITSEVELGAIGNSQNITLATPELSLQQNSQISAATDGTGRAGSIAVRGTAANSPTNSVVVNNSTISTAIQQNGVVNAANTNRSNINIQTRSLALSNGANVTASTSNQGNAGNITVRDANTVNLDGSTVSSTINRGAVGDGGSINIQTDSLNLDRANITASTQGRGGAGNVIVQDANRVSLNDRSRISTEVGATGIGQGGNITLQTGALTLNDRSRVNAQTRGQGRAGNITVRANTLEATNGGRLATSTASDRPAGTITLRVLDRIQLDGTGSGVFANTQRSSSGQGGAIDIRTTNLQLSDRAVISSASNGTNRAGNIDIRAVDLQISDRAQISSASAGNSRAGDIQIEFSETLNSENGSITTSAANSAGGNITITGGDINLLEGSNIRTDVGNGAEDGGNIRFTVDNVRLRDDSDIRTSVRGGTGSGGDVAIRADSIIAFDDSDIISEAPNRGGDITLDTPVFFGEGYQPDSLGEGEPADGNERVDLDASGQVSSGSIFTPNTDFIQNSLTDLPESVVDADSLIASSCIARTENGGTFLVIGPGGLPPRPGVAPLSPYPTDTIRTEPDAADSPELQPGEAIIEPQGVYRLPDGQLVMSRECS